MRLYLSPPHMGNSELKYVHEAFETNTIGYVGRMITDFETAVANYLDIPYCVGLSSGTAAMHLVLKHLGIGPGDTVVASSFTFIASVSPITFLGATPVFIDCDRTSWTMDIALLKRALEDAEASGCLPKAVVPTDLYGQCCDLDGILAACAPYDIPVVVDAAESLGAEYKGRKAGKGAYASIYSFNGNKIITTSGGGMIASEDNELIDHAKKLATQSRDAVPFYQHTEIGYNYRMSNIAAAIGLGQMEVLDDRVTRRREIFDRYKERLGDIPGIRFMPEAHYSDTPGSKHNRWLTVMILDPTAFPKTPEHLRQALESVEIESRPVWNPMHCQPVFETNTVYGGSVSEDLFRHGLCLPSGTAMTEADIHRVVTEITRGLVV